MLDSRLWDQMPPARRSPTCAGRPTSAGAQRAYPRGAESRQKAL